MKVRELPPGETGLAYGAMLELRPHIGSPADFVARVDQVQRPEGYRLVASFGQDPDRVAACAGFRVAHNTAWGHHLYVDDLSTLPGFRRQGHGGAVFEWLLAEAARLGCDSFHLDSGHHRFDAHRFYLGQGMDITAHHFRLDLEKS